ncbi:MSHA biogenesis protein MshE [Aliidiomarina minuta]|uniref:MSHA biogenesis protein MshE n=1 Tax=Aliidiomarina minuta TaxID=880057 RepID=A0A432W956_9GAMM|nr:GspE/PulE family protein [Aliidiomarina minuta]RUO26683.1 MSHA biogenesis protein MshE [Aliidiomarina minuta]
MSQRPRLRMRLGDLLVHEGILTENQVEHALQEQKRSGRKLGDVFVDLGYLKEQRLLEFLAHQLNLDLIDLGERRLDANIARLLPEVQARRHRALILEASESRALVGMSDPADLAAIDAITGLLSPREVDIAVVPESQLFEAFDNLYRRTQEIEQFASQLQEEHQQGEEFDLGALTLDEEGSDVTVARLLQSIFADAVQIRASDIHIEPDEKGLRIRQRIDGLLQENLLEERGIAAALVLRLKLMAGLDISEKRLPQDGRFQMEVRKHKIDVRVSTMPVQHGEACVMRLLDQSSGLLTLEKTGMPATIMRRIRRQIRRPHGMLLITGPTGSGKTTTLYGILNELNQPEKKIITVEDPVEYRLPRISQVQVNSKIGLNFANVLRTTLRQDPDIIMIGEMRDKETVEIGLRGSITGHLVLSTLHTNDAITSAMRLIDMGAPSYLVASALRAIVAQRLIRRNCDNCNTSKQPDASELALLKTISPIDFTEVKFQQGKGCQRCNYTGYRGRIGVFELLELDADMIDALRANDTHAFATAAKNNPDFVPLAEAALKYALQGVTSVEEVLTLAEGLEALPDDVEPEVADG